MLVILDTFHQGVSQKTIVSRQHKIKEQWIKYIYIYIWDNPPPPQVSGGMFHWPVIFIVAVQNETVGSRRLKQSLYGGKNQYSNIRARLIRRFHFFSEVTEEQLHLSGEFNCET